MISSCYKSPQRQFSVLNCTAYSGTKQFYVTSFFTRQLHKADETGLGDLRRQIIKCNRTRGESTGDMYESCRGRFIRGVVSTFSGQELQTVFTNPLARCQVRLTEERGNFQQLLQHAVSYIKSVNVRMLSLTFVSVRFPMNSLYLDKLLLPSCVTALRYENLHGLYCTREHNKIPEMEVQKYS
jgi:YesN/AraC family two-component response regulator